MKKHIVRLCAAAAIVMVLPTVNLLAADPPNLPSDPYELERLIKKGQKWLDEWEPTRGQSVTANMASARNISQMVKASPFCMEELGAGDHRRVIWWGLGSTTITGYSYNTNPRQQRQRTDAYKVVLIHCGMPKM